MNVFREKMIRLEKENEILLRRLEADEDSPPTVIAAHDDDGTAGVQLAEKTLVKSVFINNYMFTDYYSTELK